VTRKKYRQAWFDMIWGSRPPFLPNRAEEEVHRSFPGGRERTLRENVAHRGDPGTGPPHREDARAGWLITLGIARRLISASGRVLLWVR